MPSLKSIAVVVEILGRGGGVNLQPLYFTKLWGLIFFLLFYRGITNITTGKPYFTNFWDVFFDLYVLTTTANNPDIM